LDIPFCGFAEYVRAAADSGHNYVVRSVKYADKGNDQHDKDRAMGTMSNRESVGVTSPLRSNSDQ